MKRAPRTFKLLRQRRVTDLLLAGNGLKPGKLVVLTPERTGGVLERIDEKTPRWGVTP